MATANEFRVPDVQYPESADSPIDFQLESSKLVQANAILTRLIKEMIQEKYSLSEKIIRVNEQIKKLELKNNK